MDTWIGGSKEGIHMLLIYFTTFIFTLVVVYIRLRHDILLVLILEVLKVSILENLLYPIKEMLNWYSCRSTNTIELEGSSCFKECYPENGF